ncbi:MAG: exonuclease domain-containing protein [Devosia sp.]|nr:exonuclease domain-containing protein [Devosia sp.]
MLDLETSGLPEDERHAICEIGWVDLQTRETYLPGEKRVDYVIGDPRSYFVNPGHSIPPRIRAVHHISDRDVAAAMPPAQAVALLLKDLGPDDVLCAHKAAFEQAFIDAGARPWICTWKTSLRAWPALKSHSNQALRYELGLDEEMDFVPDQAMPPHRSLPDAYVTAFILRRLLALRPIERLIEISAEPGLLSTITFGTKHKNETYKAVAESDPSYLTWIIDKSDLDADTKFSAGFWLGKRTAA